MQEHYQQLLLKNTRTQLRLFPIGTVLLFGAAVLYLVGALMDKDYTWSALSKYDWIGALFFGGMGLLLVVLTRQLSQREKLLEQSLNTEQEQQLIGEARRNYTFLLICLLLMTVFTLLSVFLFFYWEDYKEPFSIDGGWFSLLTQVLLNLVLVYFLFYAKRNLQTLKEQSSLP